LPGTGWAGSEQTQKCQPDHPQGKQWRTSIFDGTVWHIHWRRTHRPALMKTRCLPEMAFVKKAGERTTATMKPGPGLLIGCMLSGSHENPPRACGMKWPHAVPENISFNSLRFRPDNGRKHPYDPPGRGDPTHVSGCWRLRRPDAEELLRVVRQRWRGKLEHAGTQIGGRAGDRPVRQRQPQIGGGKHGK